MQKDRERPKLLPHARAGAVRLAKIISEDFPKTPARRASRTEPVAALRSD